MDIIYISSKLLSNNFEGCGNYIHWLKPRLGRTVQEIMLDLLLLSFFHVHVILGADNPLLPIAVSFKFIHLVDMSDRAFEGGAFSSRLSNDFLSTKWCFYQSWILPSLTSGTLLLRTSKRWPPKRHQVNERFTLWEHHLLFCKPICFDMRLNFAVIAKMNPLAFRIDRS